MAWSFLENWRTLSLPDEGIGGGGYRREAFREDEYDVSVGTGGRTTRRLSRGRRRPSWLSMNGWVRVLDFSVVFFVGVV